MTDSTPAPRSATRLFAARALLALATLCLLFSAALGVSWSQDRQRLRETALAATASARTDDEKLTKLLGWVYANQGFAKNHRYFLWKKLDATPIQVLEHGGDCEDKSKLFVTMLRELGVKGTLAMLYPCKTCEPLHVVTLVKTNGAWTPMDSVYNIAFPNPRGGFFDVAALKTNPALMPSRIDALIAERGAADKITLYNQKNDVYDYVTTVNWDKNAITRAVASLIRAFGGEPWRTPRPLFLDDPKQFFVVAGLCAATGFGLIALLALWRPRKRASAS